MPQEKKFYVDLAVVTAKRYAKADSAYPRGIEEWGDKAFPGYNGMVDVDSGGQA